MILIIVRGYKKYVSIRLTAETQNIFTTKYTKKLQTEFHKENLVDLNYFLVPLVVNVFIFLERLKT